MSFEQFWTEFPRHVDKALARVKWTAITSAIGLTTDMRDRDNGRLVTVHLKATADELILAAAYYAEQCHLEGTEPRYICHPATWLNRGRWQDFDEDELRAWAEERARRKAAVVHIEARRRA